MTLDIDLYAVTPRLDTLQDTQQVVRLRLFQQGLCVDKVRQRIARYCEDLEAKDNTMTVIFSFIIISWTVLTKVS